jgi:stage III sporulation protein AG
MQKNTINRIFGKRAVVMALLVAFIGVILVLASTCGDDKDDDKSEIRVETLDPDAYAREIEEKVEELCNKIDGVGSTYAVVTLEGGYKAIYATDSQEGSSSSKNQTVVIGSGSAEQAILEGYSYPEIAGIGIVCRGGESYEVKNKIVSLISSTFNISANKIFVVGS